MTNVAKLCPDIYDYRHIGLFTALVEANPARYHMKAYYLTGEESADYNDSFFDFMLGRICTFLRIMEPDSTLTASPYCKVERVQSYEDYSKYFETILSAIKIQAGGNREMVDQIALRYGINEDFIELRNTICGGTPSSWRRTREILDRRQSLIMPGGNRDDDIDAGGVIRGVPEPPLREEGSEKVDCIGERCDIEDKSVPPGLETAEKPKSKVESLLEGTSGDILDHPSTSIAPPPAITKVPSAIPTKTPSSKRAADSEVGRAKKLFFDLTLGHALSTEYTFAIEEFSSMTDILLAPLIAPARAIAPITSLPDAVFTQSRELEGTQPIKKSTPTSSVKSGEY